MIQKLRTYAVDMVILCLISTVLIIGMSGLPANASELDDAAAQLEEAKNVAQEAQDRKEAADEALAETQERIAEIEEILPQQQEQAAMVVKSMYRQNNSELLMLVDAICNAHSLSEIIRNLEDWQYILRYRENVVMDSRNTYNELTAQQELLITEQEEAQAALEEAEKTKKDAQAAYNKAVAAVSASPSAQQTTSVDWSSASGGFITLSQMKFQGVVYYAGYRYTYYSQSVLPGGGLSIPGRHVEKGCVVDGDGYICVASSTHAKGTVVPTPLVEFPQGKVYDCGCAYGTIDLYIA